MSRRLRSVILLAALLLAFALLVLLASGRLPTGIEQPPAVDWDVPLLKIIPPSPFPTPGWWKQVVPPPTISPTPFHE